MRAALLTTCGEPPELTERTSPERHPGTTTVRTTAAPITPLDLLCASGTSYFGEPDLPYIPGVQGVGRVVASDSLPVDGRVWFATSAGMAPGNGSLAEEVVVADGDLVAVTHDVEDTLVAALGLSAVAAWMALQWRAGVRAGERVLVLGAGGVVGQVALQAARRLGASSVVAACRSQSAHEAARARGADAVVEVRDDDEPAGLARRLRETVGEVDVVLDPLCGVPATAALECLSPHGRLVNLGGSAGDTATFSSATLRSGARSILGYTNNDLTPAQRSEALSAVLHHAATDGLTVTHEVVALDHLPDAWARQASGRNEGRIVVDLTR